MSIAIAAKPEKPLLRGVSHEIAVVFALAGALVLAHLARGPRATVSAAVYGASLVVLFGTSALYHRPRWGPRLYAIMRRLDHAAIFLLIAGTYTPICLVVPVEGARTLLTVVWAGALAGIVFAVLWPRAPKWLNAIVYLALGWVLVPALPAMARALGPIGLALLGVGGLLYSIGAIVYAARRPDPFPRVFGYHEIFHALVILAAALHYAAVVGVVGAL
ncbi:MAG: hemolysin III family protein [Anaeromyxobacteraceae bacterium]